MWVTINTDASFYASHKIGGYAIWISTQLGRIRQYSSFKGNVESSNDAEFKAIINALYLLKKQNWVITGVHINTDSQNVIDYISGKQTPKTQTLKTNLDIFFNVLREMGVKHIKTKHVKSHNDKLTPRTWVNDWLDKHAKKAAKEKLNQIKQSV